MGGRQRQGGEGGMLSEMEFERSREKRDGPTDMISYKGRHAELYDLFYSDKPYVKEAHFVHRCLQRFSGNNCKHILELACGTGSHALVWDELGYAVTAVDHSEDMLACARRKAAASNSKIEFHRQDMRALNVPGTPFDAAVCLFDSIGYVLTNEALMEILRGVRQHTRTNALFIFEFWHAAALIGHYEPLRIRSRQTPEGEILRISQTRLDVSAQVAMVHYKVYELSKDGTYTSFTETQMNRYFLLQEMKYCLGASGFELVEAFSGYSEEENITESTWHIVAVARVMDVLSSGSPNNL